MQQTLRAVNTSFALRPLFPTDKLHDVAVRPTGFQDIEGLGGLVGGHPPLGRGWSPPKLVFPSTLFEQLHFSILLDTRPYVPQLSEQPYRLTCQGWAKSLLVQRVYDFENICNCWLVSRPGSGITSMCSIDSQWCVFRPILNTNSDRSGPSPTALLTRRTSRRKPSSDGRGARALKRAIPRPSGPTDRDNAPQDGEVFRKLMKAFRLGRHPESLLLVHVRERSGII